LVFCDFWFFGFFGEHAGAHVPGAGGERFMGRILIFWAQNDAQEQGFTYQ
jgi:hypothetical protein